MYKNNKMKYFLIISIFAFFSCGEHKASTDIDTPKIEAFKELELLKKHDKEVHKEKLHICDICHKSFSTKYYLKQHKSINKNNFKNDFDLLSVLRNIKIIGIFTRLSSRDKKYYYLKLIPHAWKLIENRINNNSLFNDLKLFLDDNFSKEVRQKKWKK